MSVIVHPIVSAIKGVVNLLFQWIIGAIITLLSTLLDAIFTVFGSFVFPDFQNYASVINDFWNYVFQFIGWFRSAFLIDSYSFNLIVIILTLKLTYKPLVSLIKMFIGWYKNLKL